MARKLKVFRTSIGFHDAYVAAPSQKAALEAWGTDANLFARGSAEVVTDETLVAEPLKNPGKVIKLSRGSISEQLAALGSDKPGGARLRTGPVREATVTPDKVKKAQPANKAKPRPSRDRLDEAQSSLEKLLSRQEADEHDLRARERAIQKERQTLNRNHDRDRKAAERAVEKERALHSEALNRWIEDEGG